MTCRLGEAPIVRQRLLLGGQPGHAVDVCRIDTELAGVGDEVVARLDPVGVSLGDLNVLDMRGADPG
ncbi:MAG: hypothetical protein ACT4NY_22485 [Pseudonocardiales bacterium]